eukprot:9382036-Pyramimonas_sp.AAC.1
MLPQSSSLDVRWPSVSKSWPRMSSTSPASWPFERGVPLVEWSSEFAATDHFWSGGGRAIAKGGASWWITETGQRRLFSATRCLAAAVPDFGRGSPGPPRL